MEKKINSILKIEIQMYDLHAQHVQQAEVLLLWMGSLFVQWELKG